MEMNDVPPSLEGRLGPEATAGLVELLNDAKAEWTDDVIRIVGDRFERRLTEEISRTRVEMAQGFAAVRQEMTQGAAALRQEMTEGFAMLRLEMTESSAALRLEMTESSAALRREMTESSTALRREMADQRFELLKWAFLFWVGQFFATASLIAVLVRSLRPSP